METSRRSIARAAAAAAITALALMTLMTGCGQKGALYLPDKNAKVQTRPATPAPAANPDDDKKKDSKPPSR